MKTCLYQPDSGGAALVCAIHRRLHEFTANPEILSAGINRDWADALDHGALIQDIAAHNPATAFRHHAIQAGARKQSGKQAGRSFGPWKIARKAVGRADR